MPWLLPVTKADFPASLGALILASG